MFNTGPGSLDIKKMVRLNVLREFPRFFRQSSELRLDKATQGKNKKTNNKMLTVDSQVPLSDLCAVGVILWNGGRQHFCCGPSERQQLLRKAV